MPSALDPSRPADNIPAAKTDFRNAFSAIRDELNHGGFFASRSTTAVERTVAGRLEEIVSVLDFGAVFDGTSRLVGDAWIGSGRRFPTLAAARTALGLADLEPTDEIDGVALQLANNHVAALGGGKVILPRGTGRLNRTILQDNRVIFEGQGKWATILSVVADVDGIRSRNFSSLSALTNVDASGNPKGKNRWYVYDNAAIDPLVDGGVDAGMPVSEKVNFGMGLLGLRISGSRRNATRGAGSGVLYYAKNYTIDQVVIDNMPRHGFYSECSVRGGQKEIYDTPEVHIGYLNISMCNSVGFYFRGPHDALADTLIVNGCIDDNVRTEHKSNEYSGIINIKKLHSYGMRGWRGWSCNFNSQVSVDECMAETGAAGNVLIGPNCTYSRFSQIQTYYGGKFIPEGFTFKPLSVDPVSKTLVLPNNIFSNTDNQGDDILVGLILKPEGETDPTRRVKVTKFANGVPGATQVRTITVDNWFGGAAITTDTLLRVMPARSVSSVKLQGWNNTFGSLNIKVDGAKYQTGLNIEGANNAIGSLMIWGAASDGTGNVGIRLAGDYNVIGGGVLSSFGGADTIGVLIGERDTAADDLGIGLGVAGNVYQTKGNQLRLNIITCKNALYQRAAERYGNLELCVVVGSDRLWHASSAFSYVDPTTLARIVSRSVDGDQTLLAFGSSLPASASAVPSGARYVYLDATAGGALKRA
jgi:hypothetical protein